MTLGVNVALPFAQVPMAGPAPPVALDGLLSWYIHDQEVTASTGGVDAWDPAWGPRADTLSSPTAPERLIVAPGYLDGREATVPVGLKRFISSLPPSSWSFLHQTMAGSGATLAARVRTPTVLGWNDLWLNTGNGAGWGMRIRNSGDVLFSDLYDAGRAVSTLDLGHCLIPDYEHCMIWRLDGGGAMGVDCRVDGALFTDYSAVPVIMGADPEFTMHGNDRDTGGRNGDLRWIEWLVCNARISDAQCTALETHWGF